MTLYVLVDDNGLRDEAVAGVTDDAAVAVLWQDLAPNGHVEELRLNWVTKNVDARGRFFKAARRINKAISK